MSCTRDLAPVMPECRAPTPSKGKQRVGAISCGKRSIEVKSAVKCYGHEFNFPTSDRPVCTRREMKRRTPISVRVRLLPHSLHATPLCFDCHGTQVSTTQGARNCYLSIEYSHRCIGPREGNLEYHAGQGCLWLRQRHPRDDQSESPSVIFVWLRLKRTQDAMANQMDYVELGLACAEVCTILNRGLNGKKLSDLSNSVLEAIKQLTT